jgi:tetratricopeptide (TPR) repeat protein
MRKPLLTWTLLAILIAAALGPAEAQRRGGGGRRGAKKPAPTAVPAPAEAPAEAPPSAEPSSGDISPSRPKDPGVVALEPHLLAYAIGSARQGLGGVRDPQSAEALVAEGRVLTLENRYDEAVARFDRAAAAAPDDPAPLVHKGEALLYARQDAAARQALGAAQARAQARVDHGPGDAESWLYLGMAQRHQGQLDAAYASLERARALAPSDERILYEMGATRYVQQRWQPAIDLMTQTLGINPRVAYAYYLRGIAASQANQKDLTVNDLGRFLELAPGAPEAERARKVLASLQR